MKLAKKLKHFVLSGSAAAIIFTLAVTESHAQERQPTPGQQQPDPGQQQPDPGQTDPDQANPGQQPGQQFPQSQPPAVKEDFSDKKLEKFVDINLKLAPHQQEGEQKMVKAIEEEGLQAGRFNEIMTARQTNDSTNAGASDEELQKVDAATEKIVGIQQEVEQKMTTVIEEEGMKPQEFQEILLAYQQSPKVREKVNTMIQKKQQQAAPANENPSGTDPAGAEPAGENPGGPEK